MRRRYFVRCLAPIGIHREGHEICLEAEEFAAVRGKGLVFVQFEEHDGRRVEVVGDDGAIAVPPPAVKTEGLDALSDEERKIILDRRARAESKKADDEAKAKADADKAAKAAAKADEEAKAKATDEAKAKATDKN